MKIIGEISNVSLGSPFMEEGKSTRVLDILVDAIHVAIYFDVSKNDITEDIVRDISKKIDSETFKEIEIL